MKFLRRALLGGALIATAVVGPLPGCERKADDGRSSEPSTPKTEVAGPFAILAGSELRELEPAIQKAAQAAGVTVMLSYAGTLDIVERVNGGERFDAILPPNGAYPMLALEKRPAAREKLFYSRVGLGVKASTAKTLGWDRTPPAWTDIARAAKAGQFRYAMTNPTTSNTGMSALFAVASAAAKKTEDLSVQDVNSEVIKDFLSGQKLTAGSSGWLADAYLKDPGALDGIVNYEAVILRMNERLSPAQRLRLIYPKDGVISADYPLLLLNDARRDEYTQLVQALKSAAFQNGALQDAFLRPSSPDATMAPSLSTAPVAELSFPNRLEVIDEVLSAYQSEWRRPSTSIFVLDVSGSMKGHRLDEMRNALNVLAGAQATTQTARYGRFQNRERVVLIAFSDSVAAPLLIDFKDADIVLTRERVLKFSSAMVADGGTAIFSALQAANRVAAEELAADPQRFVSIVLLTDGENNKGIPFEEFARGYDKRLAIRVFPILFGEGNAAQMAQLAELTGGRTFDARKASLVTVFRDIRGYQ